MLINVETNSPLHLHEEQFLPKGQTLAAMHL